MYTIAATPLNHPDLTALIAELDAYQQTLYPAESNHLIDLSALPAASVIALIIPRCAAPGRRLWGHRARRRGGWRDEKGIYSPGPSRPAAGGKTAGGAGERGDKSRMPYRTPGNGHPSARRRRVIHAQWLPGPQRLCAVSAGSVKHFYGEAAACRSSFSSAINASSWRVFAPRRQTSQVVSQRHSSASGQADTC